MNKKSFLLLSLLVVALSTYADETIILNPNTTTSYESKTLSQSLTNITIEIKINSFNYINLVEEGNTYCKINISGNNNRTNDLGLPSVPIIQIPIALPEGYSVLNHSFQEKSEENFTIGEIYPYQRGKAWSL